LAVPAAPPLVNVHGVKLMHQGQWDALTGTHTFTTDDFHSAVAALDCPAVRRPVLKFGHDGNSGVGLPALGWIGNMAVVDDGLTLVGDYMGVPGWLATTDDAGNSVLTSAYPDRSIEGEWNYRCQIGHLHPFVVHAVALLGVERPGIGTLPSLQDLAGLYGVELSTPEPSGIPVTIYASKESTVPNPHPMKVAAGVTTEDVRRQYYDDAPWSYWITEFHLEPLQLIVVDDNSGKHFRVPVSVTGEDAFEFGSPVEVLVRYVDAEGDQAVSASTSGAGKRLIYASRAESRPGSKPEPVKASEPEPPVTAPAAADPAPLPADDLPAAEPVNQLTQEDDMSLSEFRSRLGLPDDADEAAVLAALDGRLQPAPPTTQPEGTDDPPVPVEKVPELVGASTKPALPAGVVAIEASVLDDLRRKAELGAQAAERQRVGDRDAVITAAISDGRIPPARRDHWVTAWEADADGTKGVLASLEPGLVVPTVLAGTTGPGEDEVDMLSSHEVDSWARQLGISAEELTR
jgi:hypothetical protein